MTTQSDLLQISKKHMDNGAVQVLLSSIGEGRLIAASAHASALALIEGQRRAIAGDEGFHVMHDNTGLVEAAAKAASALSRVASDFSNLAAILQAQGEEINY